VSEIIGVFWGVIIGVCESFFGEGGGCIVSFRSRIQKAGEILADLKLPNIFVFCVCNPETLYNIFL